MKRDSIANTFVVAGALCIICSLVVSGTAVSLRSMQQRNVENDRKYNILLASGLIEADGKLSSEDINSLFNERIEDHIIDLETGDDVTETFREKYGEPSSFNQQKAAKGEGQTRDEDLAVNLTSAEDIASIKRRSKWSHVYFVKPEGGSGAPVGYVFPVRGYGLWSTLWGFMAVEADMQTVKGLTFYQHGETPGLGGEVDNKTWKAQWVGKKIYGEAPSSSESAGDEEASDLPPVELRVVKGVATDPEKEHKIDGLSGATITSKGVSNLVQYWMGENGFGKFIEKLREKSASGQASVTALGGHSHG